MTTRKMPWRRHPPSGAPGSAPAAQRPTSTPTKAGPTSTPERPRAYWDANYVQRVERGSPAARQDLPRAEARRPVPLVIPPGAPATPAVRRAWDENYMEHLVGSSGLTTAPVVRRPSVRVLAAVLVVAAAAVVGLAAVLTSVLLDDDGDSAQAVTGTPGGATTAAPPPVTPPPSGALLTATVGIGDILSVTEVLSWPSGGPAVFTLEVSDLNAVSGLTGDYAPVVSDLQVTLDGNPVEATPVDGSTTEWQVASPQGEAPSTLEVTYTLAGAIVRSEPAVEGRGLAVVSPLTRDVLGSIPLRIEIPGDAVRAISCPRASDLVGQLCGRQGDALWSADAPPGDPPVVTVQLDLFPAA